MKKDELMAFFVGLGATKTQAESLTKHTANEGDAMDATPFLDSITKHQKAVFENDTTYKKAIQDAEIGKQRDIFEAKIKKSFGLSAEEMKDKKTDEILALAVNKSISAKDATADELQKKLTVALDELTNIKEVELPAIKASVDQEKQNFKIESSLSKQLSLLKRRQGIDLDDMLVLAQTKANKAGYVLKLDDKGDVAFFTQSGAKAMTEDGKTFKSSADILVGFLDGMIEKSNADEKNKRIEIEVGKKDDLKKPLKSTMNGNLALAMKHAEDLKAENAKP